MTFVRFQRQTKQLRALRCLCVASTIILAGVSIHSRRRDCIQIFLVSLIS